MRKRIVCAIVGMLIVSLAMAATFNLKKGGVSIWFPDGWDVSTLPDGSIAAYDFERLIFCKLDCLVNVASMDVRATSEKASMDVQAASEMGYDVVMQKQYYLPAIEKEFKNFRPIQTTPQVFEGGRNGMEIRYLQGPAFRNDQDWDLTVDLYNAPGGTVIFIYGMRKDAGDKITTKIGQLKRMCESITKLPIVQGLRKVR